MFALVCSLSTTAWADSSSSGIVNDAGGLMAPTDQPSAGVASLDPSTLTEYTKFLRSIELALSFQAKTLPKKRVTERGFLGGTKTKLVEQEHELGPLTVSSGARALDRIPLSVRKVRPRMPSQNAMPT